jgi:hypothetical protein
MSEVMSIVSMRVVVLTSRISVAAMSIVYHEARAAGFP